MKDLEKQIAHVLEFDSKRCPVEWEIGVHPGNHRLNIIKPICFGKYIGKLPECEGGAVYFLDKGTAEFIAAAPLMAQIIRHQQEQLRVAREALVAAKEKMDCGVNATAVIEQALPLIGDKS